MIGALRRISMLAILVLVLLFVVLVSYQIRHFSLDTPQLIGRSFLSFWQYDGSTVAVMMPLLIIFNTLYLVTLSNRSGINISASLIAGMFLLLLIIMCSHEALELWMLVCQLLIIVITDLILRATATKLTFAGIFYMGVIAGLLTMHMLSFFLVLVFLCMVIFRLSMFSLRAFLYLILGFGVVYIYFFSFLYLNNLLGPWGSSTQISLSIDMSHVGWQSLIILAFHLFVVFVVLGSFGKYSRSYTQADQLKRSLLLIMMAGIFLSILFSLHYQDAYWIMVAPCTALLMSSYFSRSAQGRGAWIFIIIFVILSLSSIFIPL